MDAFTLSGCDRSETPPNPEPAGGPPLSAGGTVTTMPMDENDPSGGMGEMHTFTESGSLTFFEGRASVTIGYLIVAVSGGDRNYNLVIF
jgi:hypothetical protein